MTKEAYLAMCEQLGSDPIPEEIPVEYSDLPFEIQQAYDLFRYLPDKIDSFAGVYQGKDMAGVGDIMDIIGVVDKYHTLFFLKILIGEVCRQYETKRPNNGKKH